MAAIDSPMISVAQVTIVGTGLLGGSVGLGLRAAGYEGAIVGVGRRQATLDAARERGCIDRSATTLHEAINDQPSDGEHLVILATPLGRFEPFIQQMADAPHWRGVATDVGSTKAEVCAHVRRLLSGDSARRFVGSHPMAGSEKHGPAHADAALFQNRPCIITAAEGDDPAAIAIVEALWRSLGMKLIRMTPQQHDHEVAHISHLPHVVAMLLVELAAKHGGLEIASTGFRDTTRVASADPEVWLDIFRTNAQAIRDAIAAMTGRLQDLDSMFASGDVDAMHDLLVQCKAQRDAWLKGQDLQG